MDWLKEHELVDALYDAALGHDSWEEIGRQLRDHLGGMLLVARALGGVAAAIVGHGLT